MRRFSIVLLAGLAPMFVQAASLKVPEHFGSIQEAVDACSEGDTVLIAPGDYFENIRIEEKGALNLIGEGGAEKTVLDGNEKGIVIEILRSGRTVLRGLTLQRGYTVGNGGGLSVQQSDVEVLDCRFANNTADNEGGGLMVGNCSDFLVSGCSFERNESEAASAIGVVGGRGLLEKNRIRNNTGGLTISISFSGCDIRGNTITNNLSTGFGVIGYAVAYVAEVRNNTIAMNLGKEGFGAVLAQQGALRIEKNIIAFNEGISGVQIESRDNLITVEGNLIYQNEGGDYLGIEGGNGDISVDPLFCDAKGGDFRVRAGSPCLDADGGRVIGALGKGCDH
ncbi:MAG: right-handed parallel beta-helix repeat-containing protein [Candidatus Eisenbacteria bacterium]|nr:right-handed parallel beta-helix repeat-containing protein [Candidatus Eisenbacteria bacterium]